MSKKPRQFFNISEIYLQLKDESKAQEHFNEGLNIFRNKKDVAEEGHTLLKIGDLYKAAAIRLRQQFYYNQALTLLQKSLPEFHDNQRQAYALYYLSLGYSAVNDDRKALDYSNRALSIFKSLRDSVMVDIIGIRIEELSQSIKEK
jgi:tetratricopeptide (TPR) repeat protein